MDLSSGDVKRIIPIEVMNTIKPQTSMHLGYNYLEHIMVSPSGRKLAFLHRWKNHAGIYARLYVANSDGSDLRLLNDSGRMSHFCWRTEDELFGWGAVANPVNVLRRYRSFAKYVVTPLFPLYRRLVRGDSVTGNTRLSAAVSGDGYIRFSLTSSSTRRAEIPGLSKDGHPSFHPKKTHIGITDTYPARDHQCDLIALDLETGHAEILDTLKSMPEYDASPLRCDLHPKWSYDGDFVSIDTMHEQRRGIYLYRITS
jgi:Tol biopolymer transport system component